jgi:hypothetical protein
MAAQLLTPRWTVLKPHPVQQRFYSSVSRFNIVHAGRRAGKTELCKRRLIKKALNSRLPDGRYIFGAPTHRQAVDIFWEDLLAMVPKWAQASRGVSASYRRVKLRNNAVLEVSGLDVPARIEGPPVDGFVGDEYGNFKSDVWRLHVRPALSTLDRPGTADLIGVPEGHNHYFTLVEDVADNPDWSVFTWKTEEINPDEAAKAKGDLDLLSFQQEYEGEFVSFKGRAYYTFDRELNCPPDGVRVVYDPGYPLIFCWDFNRIPGNCAIIQELPAPDWLKLRNSGRDHGAITCAIGEIFLEQDSNTEIICDRLIRDWSHHRGPVVLHGDATGGAKVSSGVSGSDWDIINAKLGSKFNLFDGYPRSNPPIRVRINAVNTRMRSADGHIGCVIDMKACPKLIRDLESVTCDDRGDIEKNSGSMLTHISDAIGYYITEEHPCGGGKGISVTEV